MKKSNDEGFTLIELLIVIVILGILATVVVFAVAGITDKGETSACKADYKTLEVAVEAYYAQTGTYPAAVGALTTAPYKLLRDDPTYFGVTAGGELVSVTALPDNCPDDV
jgi:prepilin-type N-terminal cleavage/methylation domain-containing protein